RVAAVLDLLRRAAQLVLRVARVGEHRHQAGGDEQADGDRDHQLDEREACLAEGRAAHDRVAMIRVVHTTRRWVSAPYSPVAQFLATSGAEAKLAGEK